MAGLCPLASWPTAVLIAYSDTYEYDKVMLFCPLPWIHSAIRNNGDFRVCCQANVSEDRGILQNSGQTLSAHKSTISETRNSESLKEIRKTMLSGKWPSSCQRCKSEEESGLRSRRIYENQDWSKYFTPSQARNLTEDDGTINEQQTPLLFLDVRFGNKCNLKCRMCGPTDSDFWYQDQGDLWGPTFKDTHGKVILKKNDHGLWRDPNRTYDWYSENEFFWKDLEAHSESLKKINIVGGEPLLIEQHYEFLEQMVHSRTARNTVLEYNTNLTVLPQKALDLWRYFQKVRIGVSVDGYGANNNYIRSPSKWEILVRNLKRLDQADGFFELWLSATVQILNVFEITDLIRWKLLESELKNFNKSRRLPVITSHVLHKPEFLSLKSLPPQVKEDVEIHYSSFLDSLPSREVPEEILLHTKSLLDGYIKFMKSKDSSSEFGQFLKYTRSLDKVRNESLEAGSPKLYASLTKYGLFDLKSPDHVSA